MIKKLLSMVLTLVMLMGMGTTASATENKEVGAGIPTSVNGKEHGLYLTTDVVPMLLIMQLTMFTVI